MFSTDPIQQLITRTQADATATRAPQVAPQRTIGPAPTRAPQAQPIGGALGALYGAGESVHNGIVARMQTGPTKGDAATAIALAFPELKGIGRAAASLAETKALPVAYEGTASLFPAMMERHAAGGVADESLASLRTALPNSPAPGIRDVAQTLAASSQDTEALRNMMETGFAGGKTAAMVELPASGAGRAGSTATAMKQALQTTPPLQFRSLVEREIARRGGATAPEVSMAATEEVARKLASGETEAVAQPRNLFRVAGDSTASKVAQAASGKYSGLRTDQLANEFVTNAGDLSRGAGDSNPRFADAVREKLAELKRRGTSDEDIMYHFANRQAELGYAPDQSHAALARFRKTVESLGNPRLAAP